MTQTMPAGWGQAVLPPQPVRPPGSGAWAAWLAGAVMLGAEAVTVVTAAYLLSFQDEWFLAGGFPALFGYLVTAVVMAIFLTLFAVFGSTVAVLPLHLLSRWVARRKGRRDRWWWCLGVIAAVAAAVAIVVGSLVLRSGDAGFLVYPLLWLGLVAALAPATLVARAAAGRRSTGARWAVVAAAAGGGVALWLVVLVAGIAAYPAGILKAYEPPRLTAGELAGTWSDGHGGTLRLEASGKAVANGADSYPFAADYEDEPEECNGTGHWREGLQEDGIGLDIEGCELPFMTFGGTQDKPTLYYWIGDPDSGNRYILTRQD
ncbi:hypothetical protein [Streptomyces sp. NPDC056468]|uniref:hypothetical protein n=1 Tax=Streptomyces sp. NPDC056468 TaxID=3345830 RepID=UPI00367B6F39